MKLLPILSILLIACAIPMDAKKCTPKATKPSTLTPNTSAPAKTSPVPGVTTGAPSVTTAAPSVTTAAPSATTAAPGTTTAPPAATTAIPGVTTAAPSVTTAAPGVTTPAPTNSTGGDSGSGKVLSKGTGSGTYYYDANGAGCHESSFAESTFYTFCESWQDTSKNKKLNEYKNNFIVAMDQEELAKRRAELCGKKVRISYKGKPIPGDFVVWDGCGACKGGVRLDFSATALQQIEPNACAMGVVPGVSWEVLDEQAIPFAP